MMPSTATIISVSDKWKSM